MAIKNSFITKNKKHYIPLLWVLIILISSCSKDLLEQFPTTSISPQTFFKSENDLKSYTNSFYGGLNGGSYVYGETADNIVKSSVPSEVSGTRLVPTTDGTRWNWSGLRNINFFLNNENVKNFSDERVRDHYVGIARFFRAAFYFEKVQWYGDVPWYSNVIGSKDEVELMKARDSRILIMDSIMADLDFAIAHVSDINSVERVTKWTALAMKSRAALYEGTWRKYHDEFALPGSDELLQKSIDASLELINSGRYRLYTSTSGPSGNAYQDLFASMSLDDVADEVIIGRRYDANLGVRHGLQFYITARTQGKPGLEKRLVNSYLMADGSRFTDIDGYETMEYADEIKNRDPRLGQTIRFPGYKRIGQTAVSSIDFNATTTGYQPIKWLNDPGMDGSSQSFQDLALMRYGEVLLNYAEAKAELRTLTQADLDMSIGRLRSRAGMPGLDLASANAMPDVYQSDLYPNVTGNNKGVILEIRRERRIELVMENNNRWDDLMRWKAGHLLVNVFEGMYFPSGGFFDLDGNGVNEIEIYSGSKPPATGPYQLPVSQLSDGVKGNIVVNEEIVKVFDERKDYLWPLPIEDRELNKNLEQNPYWPQ